MQKNVCGQTKSLERLAIMAMMLAMEIVLSRFLSVYIIPSVKIAFNFVPIAIVAYLYGPIASTVVAALGDLIGATLFPVGAFFPGFTVTAALTGLIMGIFLYRRFKFPSALNCNVCRIIAGVVIVQAVLTILLDSYWCSQYFGTEYLVNVSARSIKAGVMAVAECVVLIIIIPIISKISSKLKI